MSGGFLDLVLKVTSPRTYHYEYTGTRYVGVLSYSRITAVAMPMLLCFKLHFPRRNHNRTGLLLSPDGWYTAAVALQAARRGIILPY